MNKYEILFADILKQTKAGLLKWKQLHRYANSEIIFSPNIVFRQFESTLVLGSNEYKLLLIEKKYDDPEHDFVFDSYVLEMLILDDGELVTTLSDSVIERSDLIKLANMVETRSDKASRLFEGVMPADCLLNSVSRL